MDDLSTLMREAVEDVEPTDRRAELREQVVVASKKRTRLYAITGGLLAAAVVVTGVAVTTQQSDEPETAPAGTKHAVDRSRDSRPAYALYYVGETPQGPRLYREFRTGPGPETTPAAALRLLTAGPDDPDYTSYWSAGQLLGAEVVDGVIEVAVDPSLTNQCDGVPSATWGSSRWSTRCRQRPVTRSCRSGSCATAPRSPPSPATGRPSRSRLTPRSTCWRWRASATRRSGGSWRDRSAPTAGPAPSRATCPGSCWPPTEPRCVRARRRPTAGRTTSTRGRPARSTWPTSTRVTTPSGS